MAVLFCQEALEYKVLEYKVYTSNLAVLIAQMAEALRPDILDESEKSNSWLRKAEKENACLKFQCDHW